MTDPTAEKDDLEMPPVVREKVERPELAELTTLRAQLASMRDALNDIAPAVESLARHQVQCDVDGVMVQVSRQAVDEVVNAINAIVIGPRAALNASPGSAGNTRKALDGRSYDAGLEAAATICEKPVCAAFDPASVEPPAPRHASLIRSIKGSALTSHSEGA